MNKLTQAERVQLLRELTGHLQADRHPGAAWLGAAIGRWLHHGGDLAALLGARTVRGSKNTAQALTRRAEVDALLRRLALACGTAQAALILRGSADCPVELMGTVERLRELNAPSSPAAFWRASRRLAHQSR